MDYGYDIYCINEEAINAVYDNKTKEYLLNLYSQYINKKIREEDKMKENILREERNKKNSMGKE